MANVKISELPTATTLSAASKFVAVQSGITVQAPYSMVSALPNVKQSGAEGNGTTNDGASISAAITSAGTGMLLFPSATYLTSALTASSASKLEGGGSTLKPSANSMTVVTLAEGVTMSSPDFQLVQNLNIDGTGKTGITGVKGAGSLVAGLILRDVVAYNCDTVGFDLQNSQFIRSFAIKAHGQTGTGMLIKNLAVVGGGNSHDHYQFQAHANEVGVFVNGSNFTGGCASINFYNPQCLANSVCGMAFFDTDAVIYGGAPEANCTGAATVVVDGKTVKRSSMYLNNSRVRVNDLRCNEASADPCYLLESGSSLMLKDATGYGVPTGVLVSADATSGVHLSGSYSCIGIAKNVVSWPQSFVVQTNQMLLYGEPVNSTDSSFTALSADQAPVFAPGGVNLPTASYVEDADLGYCRQIVFAAATGSVSDNHADCPVGVGVASRDNLFTLLCKASADCLLGINVYNGSGYNEIGYASIALKANKVTRIVMAKNSIPANGTWFVVVYAGDATAPTVKFSRLQAYQGAAGTAGTKADISKIVQYGAFNPGVTRETAVNLALKAQSVNILNKYPGKQVWDTTNNRVVFAAGRADTDVWKDGVNSTVYTPV